MLIYRPTRLKNVRWTENPREFGVVSFRNDEDHAIAPARVLIGIIAASRAVSVTRVEDLLKPSQNINLEDIKRRDAEIDAVLAVTVGDIWAFGAAPSDVEKGTSRFGATGKWNSTICQTEYVLTSKTSRGSLAEIRGGIDGLLLGRKAKEVLASGARFKLSGLLRQYYSPHGLFDDYTSVCQRGSVSSSLTSLKDQVKNYMYAYIPLMLGGGGYDENRINGYVEDTSSDWDNAIRQAVQTENDDRAWCDSAREASSSSLSTQNNQVCETPSDVIVMVDLEEEIEQQMELVTKIANGLDMRKHGSSMTIVASTRGGGSDYSTEGLSRIAWNSTSRGCVTCRLAWADKSNYGTPLGKQPDILLNNINTTLRDLKADKADERGAPGKPFLFFNYGFTKKPSGDTSKFYRAKYDLRTNHRDVPLIVIGKGNGDDLEEFAYNKEDVLEADKPESNELAKDILKRICQTPATFQYEECAVTTSNQEAYDGYVTPGTKQYWAMYPEYFLKSFTVTFEFTATNGPIKVCYRRGTPRPEEDERNCQQVKPGEAAIIFRVRNPCHKYSLSDCYPFYFTVIGLREGTVSVNNKCKGE